MEKILALILKIFKARAERKIAQPTSIAVISMRNLKNILKDKFPEGEIYLSDMYYLLCSRKDIVEFLATDRTNKMTYVTDELDCDDFSYRLMGQFSVKGWSHLAFGIVWTDKHALNLFVDVDMKVWFIEPQSDKVQEELEEWQGSKMRFVVL